MPLNHNQQQILKDSIIGYSFPAVYYDFEMNTPGNAQNMADVEQYINTLLKSKNVIGAKHGLANVLYWGYAQVGFREIRVTKLLDKVTENQITNFQKLLINSVIPTMIAIKNLNLPEFSGMSFISKILMFLNPQNYCILDKKISKLRNPECTKALSHLAFGPKEKGIRISQNNQKVYNAWREECRAISAQYYNKVYRVADVERGFFTLIQGNLVRAREIYNVA
jgi:hypothetical protein